MNKTWHIELAEKVVRARHALNKAVGESNAAARDTEECEIQYKAALAIESRAYIEYRTAMRGLEGATPDQATMSEAMRIAESNVVDGG